MSVIGRKLYDDKYLHLPSSDPRTAVAELKLQGFRDGNRWFGYFRLSGLVLLHVGNINL